MFSGELGLPLPIPDKLYTVTYSICQEILELKLGITQICLCLVWVATVFSMSSA